MAQANLLAPQAPNLEPIRKDQASESGMSDQPKLNPEAAYESNDSVQAAGEPTEAPPLALQATAGEASITAWQNNKKAVALWANASPRNSWVSLAGLGWKKINPANDSSNLALTMLASHAELTNATVNARIEADGTIHEMYIW